MQTVVGKRASTWPAELLAVSYLGIVTYAAHLSGIYLLLFPELAALSHDVLTRPRGKWASQPWRMILTPTLAAVAGLFITRHARYGTIAMAVIVLITLFIIKVLKSAIAPALSAGVLPMVLDEKSWMYPLAIFAGLVGLIAVLRIWQRFGRFMDVSGGDDDSKLIDAFEMYPRDRFWAVTLLAFVLVLGVPAQLTGLRFILFPPLIVMAYEIFGHPEVPSWMARPALFPVVCLLTASVGVVMCRSFASNVVGVVLTMLCSIAILRIFKVHMPPALAVGLLPFIIPAPTLWYAVSVGIGTVALMVCFWGREYFWKSWASAEDGVDRAATPGGISLR